MPKTPARDDYFAQSFRFTPEQAATIKEEAKRLGSTTAFVRELIDDYGTLFGLPGIQVEVLEADMKNLKIQTPVSAVERRKVPRRVYVTLREEELPRVLAEVPSTWRDLFTVAIWTGMRKGELLGLRKADLDLEGRTILVARSYDRATTKGGHADV